MSQKIVNHVVDTKSFLLTMESFFGGDELAEIKEALDWAIEAHEGQVRKYEGIPYITHPMAVAVDVAQKYQDKDLVLASILHDIVEDCDVMFQEVYEKYGKAVGYMVEAVSKSPLFFIDQPDVVYGDKIEKLLAGGMTDVRVLLLKIADRDHNLKSLEGLKPNKQIRMTFETQAIYEPLKILIGKGKSIFQISEKMDNMLSIKVINDVRSFKNHLFSQTFESTSNHLYNLIYENSGSIVWQINDQKWFEGLISKDDFKDSIEVISMKSDGNNFVARFKFVKGLIPNIVENVRYSIYEQTQSYAR